MKIDISKLREEQCTKCEQYAGKQKTKLTFGKKYCLGTDKDILNCPQIRVWAERSRRHDYQCTGQEKTKHI
jgi:hypothetical protein